MLRDIENSLPTTSPEIRLDAHLVGLWAGIHLSDNEVLAEFSQKILLTTPKPLLKKNINRLLIASAGQLWRAGDTESTYKVAQCALGKAQSFPRFVSSILMLAVSLSNSHPVTSNFINNYGLTLAKEKSLDVYIAAFDNNMGVYALQIGNFEAASEHFTRALDIRYKTAHLTGQLNSISNLMLSYIFQENWEKFARISIRANRLNEISKSRMYYAYYRWMMKIFTLQDTEVIKPNELEYLQSQFNLIDDKGLQTTLYKAGKKFGISMQLSSVEPVKKTSQLLEFFKVCDWQQSHYLSIKQLKSLFTNIEYKLNPANKERHN